MASGTLVILLLALVLLTKDNPFLKKIYIVVIWQHILVVPELLRVRQEDCLVTSEPACATEQEPITNQQIVHLSFVHVP